jgi:hypothetical protein
MRPMALRRLYWAGILMASMTGIWAISLKAQGSISPIPSAKAPILQTMRYFVQPPPP